MNVSKLLLSAFSSFLLITFGVGAEDSLPRCCLPHQIFSAELQKCVLPNADVPVFTCPNHTQLFHFKTKVRSAEHLSNWCISNQIDCSDRLLSSTTRMWRFANRFSILRWRRANSAFMKPMNLITRRSFYSAIQNRHKLLLRNAVLMDPALINIPPIDARQSMLNSALNLLSILSAHMKLKATRLFNARITKSYYQRCISITNSMSK